MKLSPVPREEDVVTDNSSVFQSPPIPTEGSKNQSQGEAGASPTLPSKYETCTSSGRLGQINSSSSNQEFVTGETGDKGSGSPNYYNGSVRITRGPFKGARIPTLIFDSPHQNGSPSLHQDGLPQGSGSDEPLRLDTSELPHIIKTKTRTQKGVKRLGKNSHNFSTKQNTKTTQERKTRPSWLAKRFSPIVTRGRSRRLGLLSDESQNTDSSCFEKTLDKNDKTAELRCKHRMNQNKRNVSRGKSKRLASQKTEDTLDTDDNEESTIGTLPPPEESLVIIYEKQPPRETERKSVVTVGDNKDSCGLPPIAKRSLRHSRKINLKGVSSPRERSTRLSSLIHKPQESSISRRSRKVHEEELPVEFSPMPVRFHPGRGRRDNQLIFYRPDSSQSTATFPSVSSSPGVSLSYSSSDSFQHPEIFPIKQLASLGSIQHSAGTVRQEGKNMSSEAFQQTTNEESTGAVMEGSWPRNVSHGGGCDEADATECVFKQPYVLLRKLKESDLCSSTTNGSESVLPLLPPLPVLPTKPGKGWRRSIAMRARALSLPAAEQITDTPALMSPTSITMGTPRRVSRLRMMSVPTELSPRLPPVGNKWLDSPQRSVLQMSYLGDAGEIAPPAPVVHDPRQKVLELCSQHEPLPFTQCFSDSRLANCRKIGEGVYGEVFMTQPNPSSLEGARVLKVMPIEGNFPVNGEPQKKFEEILSEMVISLELSELRATDCQISMTENFVHVQASWCVEGAYPQELIHLWDLYNEEKGSENDRPDIFPDTQLYVVLEFGHGGRDLESFVFNNARDLMGVFLQIAYSLAVAEEALEFEHRDLHWGNVLVAPTSDAKINFKLDGETFTLNTHGLKATVIDFTLSRIKLPKYIVFNNLAEDPSLFTSEGDYQFEVYRLMQQTNNNDWEAFKPYTNVLWLHYLLVKMTSECYIKNTNTKVHRTHHAELLKMKDAMLSYESASHFLLSRQ